MTDGRGAQFDILDKAVAARARELLSRDSVSIQDVQEWQTDYAQLAAYGRNNSDVPYVARQWKDEEPRYANVVSWLMQKVKAPVAYTPRLYDARIPISGYDGCCGCSDSNQQLPTLPPIDMRGNYGGGVPTRAGTIFNVPGTVGDGIKNFLFPTAGQFQAPQIPLQQEQQQTKLIDPGWISNSVIAAIVIGAVFFVIHYVTKKNFSPG